MEASARNSIGGSGKRNGHVEEPQVGPAHDLGHYRQGTKYERAALCKRDACAAHPLPPAAAHDDNGSAVSRRIFWHSCFSCHEEEREINVAIASANSHRCNLV